MTAEAVTEANLQQLQSALQARLTTLPNNLQTTHCATQTRAQITTFSTERRHSAHHAALREAPRMSTEATPQDSENLPMQAIP